MLEINPEKWANEDPEMINIATDAIVDRMTSNQKRRPVLDPGTKYISKVLDSMKEGVLKITKKAREMHKELGLDHHYENILSDEWLNSEYQTFSCQVRGKYIEWKH